MGPPADIDLHGLAEARSAGYRGGVHGYPGGVDMLVIGAEPRQNHQFEMGADPRLELAHGDRRKVANPGDRDEAV
jgi:hypothetical protein